jgi:hypothetical protein
LIPSVGSRGKSLRNCVEASSVLHASGSSSREARVIPYRQIVGGGVYTDISEGGSQGLVSEPVEFNLQGTVGLRVSCSIAAFPCSSRRGYQHTSNAAIKLPNRGIDSVSGAMVRSRQSNSSVIVRFISRFDGTATGSTALRATSTPATGSPSGPAAPTAPKRTPGPSRSARSSFCRPQKR